MRKFKVKNTITMLPLLILALFFIFMPIASMLKDSFTMPEAGGFTLDNYKTILTDSVYIVATKNSIYLSLISSVVGLILSFFIAYSINEIGKKRSKQSIIDLKYGFKFCWSSAVFCICCNSGKYRCIRFSAEGNWNKSFFGIQIVFNGWSDASVYLFSDPSREFDACTRFSGNSTRVERSGRTFGSTTVEVLDKNRHSSPYAQYFRYIWASFC